MLLRVDCEMVWKGDYCLRHKVSRIAKLRGYNLIFLGRGEMFGSFLIRGKIPFDYIFCNVCLMGKCSLFCNILMNSHFNYPSFGHVYRDKPAIDQFDKTLSDSHKHQ